MTIKARRLDHVKEYYFSRKLREVRQLKAEGKPVINIGIGSPDLEPPASVLEVLANTAKQENVHGYQSYQGLPELRDAIAAFYSKMYGVSLNPENEILPLMGSKEGIMHISMAFLNLGDKVLIPNPGYPTYASVTKLVGAQAVFYELKEENNWLPDLEELAKTDLSEVKIMWVNYPHMPTGAKAGKSFFNALVAFAKKHELLLINDNPYSFILNTEPASILSVPGAKETAIELNSLSKSFNMSGWRIGMLSGSADHLQAVLQVKSNMDSGMFYGLQKGAVAALQEDDSWFREQDKIYRKRQQIAFHIADKLACTYSKNSAGLFVWAKLPEGINAEEMADKLLYQYHVFLAPGTIFGSRGAGYIRISLCLEEALLKEVYERLGKYE